MHSSIQGTMMPHQLKSLSFFAWLYRNGTGGILADEMGLGKTLQTLALLQHTRDISLQTLPESHVNLVICPKSVVAQWMNEAARFAPELRTLKMLGSAKQREETKKLLRESGYRAGSK